MLSSLWKKISPILWQFKLANSIPATYQPEGYDGSEVDPSRLESQAPVSSQSNTFTLDKYCISRLMEDVRNFLQESPVQASPLDTTQRFQNADNSGYQALLNRH